VVFFSVMAWDFIMALTPNWVSPLFGWFVYAGAFISGISVVTLLATRLRAKRGLEGYITTDMLWDIGKVLFAWCIFWVYLMWSQYLPIWYADLPEETFFVVPRIHRLPWGILGWLAFLLVWAVPFSVLMGRRPKKTPAIFGTVCLLGLLGMWVERYVLVVPSLSRHAIPLGWVEALVSTGFLGLFALVVAPGVRLVPVHPGGEA